jgi:hypothetical protein
MREGKTEVWGKVRIDRQLRDTIELSQQLLEGKRDLHKQLITLSKFHTQFKAANM